MATFKPITGAYTTGTYTSSYSGGDYNPFIKESIDEEKEKQKINNENE